MRKNELVLSACAGSRFSADSASGKCGTVRIISVYPRAMVHGASLVLSRVVCQELYGSWDQPTETVVLRKEDPNTLQLLALKFADKVRPRLEVR